MLLIQAAILGVVQGLTEFLPVSSSGHLIVVREALGWELLADPHLNKMFDVALHAGTLFALLTYFWQDILRLFASFGASIRFGLAGHPERRLVWLLVVGTIPAAVAGLAAQDVVETKLGAPLMISALLLAFGLLLWLADWRGRRLRGLAEAGWGDGIIVGLAQALALVPGVSRSGITITAGLARGMTRDAAARFSFLLSIPIIGGTVAYGLASLARDGGALAPDALPAFALGTAAAALSGYLCIRYFLRYLQTRSLMPFVIYRLFLGVILVIWFARAA